MKLEIEIKNLEEIIAKFKEAIPRFDVGHFSCGGPLADKRKVPATITTNKNDGTRNVACPSYIELLIYQPEMSKEASHMYNICCEPKDKQKDIHLLTKEDLEKYSQMPKCIYAQKHEDKISA